MVSPFSRLTKMPLEVGILLLHGVSGPRKWLVHPKSAMARQEGLLGTTGIDVKMLTTAVL